jgi:putative flippase GtrA
MGSFWKLVGFANTYSTGFLVYLAVACLSVATEWGTFAIAATMLSPIEAALLGFITATGVNFVLSRKYVFQSRSSWSSELVLVTLASAAVFVWNLAVFYVLYRFLGVHLMIAKMVGTGAGFVLNFAARQFLIFSPVPRYQPISSRLAGPHSEGGKG